MELKISDVILQKLKEHQKETSFKKLDELVEYILEEYLKNNAEQGDSPSMPDEINQRLKDLGYL